MKISKNLLKLAAVALLTSQQLFAQTPTPALVTHTSGLNSESARSTTTDAQGNIFIEGNMQGSFVFEGTTVPMPAGFSSASFLARKANGGQSWAISISGGFLSGITNLSTDAAGNVLGLFYGFGTLGDTIRIGSYSTTYISSPTAMIVKLDSLGGMLWTKSIVDTNYTGIPSNIRMTTDAQGNIYLAGHMVVGSLAFDTIVVNPVGAWDGQFLAKANSAGNFIWAKSFGSKADEGQSFQVSVDTQNDIFLSGGWEGDTMFLDALTLVNPTPGGFFNTDRYIAKLDANGNAEWMVREGGTDGDEPSMLVPNGNGGVDCFSQVYGASIVINEGGITVAANQMLLSRYDALGDFKSYDTYPLTTSNNGIYPMTGDGTDLYIGFGFTTPTYTIGSTTLQNAGGAVGTGDIGIAKLDTMGNVIWAISIGAQEEEALNALAHSTTYGLLVSGETSSAQLILGSDSLNNAGLLTTEGFVAAIMQGIGVQENTLAASINVYPNPAKDVLHLDFEDVNAQTARVTIISATGQVVKRTNVDATANTQINISDLAPGLYVLEIGVGKNYTVKKFIRE